MPTPPRAFAEIAARYGNVDPGDAEAVLKFFTLTYVSLPQETMAEILEELLAREGMEAPVELCYPDEADVPRLDASPPARAPLLAHGWRDLFCWMLRVSGRRV